MQKGSSLPIRPCPFPTKRLYQLCERNSTYLATSDRIVAATPAELSTKQTKGAVISYSPDMRSLLSGAYASPNEVHKIPKNPYFRTWRRFPAPSMSFALLFDASTILRARSPASADAVIARR